MVLYLVSIPAVAQASEQGFFTMNLVWSIVNFVILVVGFVYLYRRFHGEKFFQTRKANIEKLIGEAMDVKHKALQRHDDIVGQMDAFDRSRQQIIDDMNARTEQEKRAILDEGQEMIERIKKEGQRIVDAEVQKAKDLIGEHVQGTLYELSKAQIERAMDSDAQKSVSDNFIRKLK